MNKLGPLALILLWSSTTLAGETDQHYTWRRPLAESAPAYNAYLNQHFTEQLRGVSRWPWAESLRCRDVALDLVDGLLWKEYRFFIRSQRGDGLIWAPYSTTERATEYRRYGLYRYAPPWSPAFAIIPLDSTVRLGDVYVGTDKIAHFFPNGVRYYKRYHEVLDAGGSEAEAYEAAIQLGIEQELGIFGLDFGTFSYADLEANDAGLQWFLALCDAEEPQLFFDEEASAWRLREAFDITEWVSPCWDESYYPNYYAEGVWPFVKKGLLDYCPMLDFPEIRRRFQRYRERGCESRTMTRVRELLASGELPDPEPQSMETVCYETGAAAP